MGPELLSHALPGDQYLLLREEILTFGLLLGSGELVIRQAELLAAWLTDTTARPLATERVSADWVGG